MLVEGRDVRSYPPTGQTSGVTHYLRCLSLHLIDMVGTVPKRRNIAVVFRDQYGLLGAH